MSKRESRESYNAYMKEYMLKRYHARREEAKILLGGKCVDCSSIENLEFDHINPEEKEFVIAKLWSTTKERFLKEVYKCELRCKSCHKKRTIRQDKERRPWRHGTYWSVQKKKCRCKECRDFMIIMAQKRREKRIQKNNVSFGSLR